MSNTEQTTQAPVVGEALTRESILLLLEGDALKHYRLGLTFVREACPVGVVVSEGLFDWTNFTFLGRPGPDGWIPNPGFNPAPGMRIDVEFKTGGRSEYFKQPWDSVARWRPASAPVSQPTQGGPK